MTRGHNGCICLGGPTKLSNLLRYFNFVSVSPQKIENLIVRRTGLSVFSCFSSRSNWLGSVTSSHRRYIKRSSVTFLSYKVLTSGAGKDEIRVFHHKRCNDWFTIRCCFLPRIWFDMIANAVQLFYKVIKISITSNKNSHEKEKDNFVYSFSFIAMIICCPRHDEKDQTYAERRKYHLIEYFRRIEEFSSSGLFK